MAYYNYEFVAPNGTKFLNNLACFLSNKQGIVTLEYNIFVNGIYIKRECNLLVKVHVQYAMQ